MQKFFFLLCLLVCVGWVKNALAYTLSTLEAFARITLNFFENTMEGLDEEQKNELLIWGRTSTWQIKEVGTEHMVVESLLAPENKVLVQLFSAEHSLVLAIGTDTGPLCAMELWLLDEHGRVVPYPQPEEPSLFDFFQDKRYIPPDASASMFFCVRRGGLEAVPLFWTSTGIASVPVQNAVYYVWDGTHFSPRILEK